MQLNNTPFIELLNQIDPYYFRHTNLESLKTLRDFLKSKVPDEKFDLNHWRKNKEIQPGQPNDTAWAVTSYDLQHECGTVGCILGWAAAIDDFRERGLEYDLNLGEVKFNNLFGTTAGANFFNMPEPVSIQLFMPDYYGFGSKKQNQGEKISKADAIKRLEVLINHVEKLREVNNAPPK